MTNFTHVTWRKSSHSHTGADCVEVGEWRKSSCSAQQGDCVEVGATIQAIMVRDSKNPEGTKLVFSRREWAALTGKIKENLPRPD